MGNLSTFVKLSCTPVTSSEFLSSKIVFQLLFVCALGIQTHPSQIMIALPQLLVSVSRLRLAKTSKTMLIDIPIFLSDFKENLSTI